MVSFLFYCFKIYCICLVMFIHWIWKCVVHVTVCVVSVGRLSVHGKWNKFHTMSEWCQLWEWYSVRYAGELHLCLCSRVHWTVLWTRSDWLYVHIHSFTILPVTVHSYFLSFLANELGGVLDVKTSPEIEFKCYVEFQYSCFIALKFTLLLYCQSQCIGTCCHFE